MTRTQNRTGLASAVGNRAMARMLQRQSAPLTGCSPSQSRRVRAAIAKARDLVRAAFAALENPPAPGTTYATALSLHFLDPDDAQRRIIRAVYRRMLGELGSGNFVCVPATNPGCGGSIQAFWDPADDLVHVCPRFFSSTQDDEHCPPVVLIHELAHDVGVDLAGAGARPSGHTGNRGSPSYPVAGGGAPRRRVTPTGRSFTPDAYAFFAAHLHTGRDTAGDCF